MPQRPLIRIVDDDEALRDALTYTIESEGWEAAPFADAASFLAGDLPSRTGVLVLDVRMPGMNGIDLYRTLQKRNYGIPVIFLTAHGDIDMAVTVLRTGAFHFLQKPVSRDELLEALREALSQESTRAEADARKALNLLTDRERNIAARLAQGATNREISEDLGLSVRTVENHHAAIYRKLRVNSVSEIKEILEAAS